jgi:hypothetical protein
MQQQENNLVDNHFDQDGITLCLHHKPLIR